MAIPATAVTATTTLALGEDVSIEMPPPLSMRAWRSLVLRLWIVMPPPCTTLPAIELNKRESIV